MSEVSESIRFFIDLAAETGREVNYSEVPYPSNLIHRVVYHKRTVSMAMDETIWLLSYHDPKGISETQSLYSGFFTTIGFPEHSSLTIKKKYLIHRLGLMRTKEEVLTLGARFDREVIIAANPLEQHNLSFLQHQKMQVLVLQLFKIDERFTIGFNGVTIGFEPAFSEQSNFGIFIPGDWLKDRKTFEAAYHLFVAMRLQIMAESHGLLTV